MNKVAFLTMDVESYYDATCLISKNVTPNRKYSCASQVKRYLDYLDNKNIKATFFVVVSFLPEVKEYLLEAVKRGHEIGLHALTHKVIKNQNIKEFDFDIKKSIQIIKDELGVTPISYRAPCFEIDEQHLKVIHENGLVFDSSLRSSPEGYEKLNDIVYKKDSYYEFIVKTKKVLGKTINFHGGGYARTLPILPLIKKQIRNSDAYIFYFHPFEIYEGKLIDQEGLSQLEKSYLNRGRKNYFNKIKKIIELLVLEGYEFKTFKEFAK